MKEMDESDLVYKSCFPEVNKSSGDTKLYNALDDYFRNVFFDTKKFQDDFQSEDEAET